MRLFIFFTAVETGLLLLLLLFSVCFDSSMDTVGQRSLALIPALVGRHSCFSLACCHTS